MLMMRQSKTILIYGCALLAVLGSQTVWAVPVEGVATEAAASESTSSEQQPSSSLSPTEVENADVSVETASASEQPVEDLQTAGTEQQANHYVGQVMIPDQTAAAATFDPSIYAGLVSADAFQQYMSQFGGAYAPFAAPYPAPVGYAPAPQAPYPGPYVMQTGYEGYLVPTTATATTTTTTSTGSTSASNTNGSTTTTVLSPLSLLRELLPTLMMSSVFRVIAMVLSAVGVIFFGGAITTAICSFTPICDITFKAVTYMRHRGAAETVGRMLAEGMTPERVRRTTDFVWKAIRKYNDLQKALGGDDGDD